MRSTASDIAGAVVVIVKDGKVLTQRGYGYADIASRRKVDPETTLFRVGSIIETVHLDRGDAARRSRARSISMPT